MSRVIVIRNWDKFQHYKDRGPTWIKLYQDTLTTESWVLGDDLSRLVQLASTMLAARYQNATPLNFKLIRSVLNLDCDETKFMAALAHLERHKFLEISEIDDCEQDASSVLAGCYLREEESRGEKSRGEKKVAATFVASDLPDLDGKAWSEWLDYRKASGKPIKPASLRAAASEMAKLGAGQYAAVTHSIANGYQGLFAPKVNGKPAAIVAPAKPAPSAEAIDAARAEAARLNREQIAKVMPGLRQ